MNGIYLYFVNQDRSRWPLFGLIFITCQLVEFLWVFKSVIFFILAKVAAFATDVTEILLKTLQYMKQLSLF